MKVIKSVVERALKINQYRSSRPEVFCKKVVLRNFAEFTRKHLRKRLFFNKVARTPFSYRTPSVAASANIKYRFITHSSDNMDYPANTHLFKIR